MSIDTTSPNKLDCNGSTSFIVVFRKIEDLAKMFLRGHELRQITWLGSKWYIDPWLVGDIASGTSNKAAWSVTNRVAHISGILGFDRFGRAGGVDDGHCLFSRKTEEEWTEAGRFWGVFGVCFLPEEGEVAKAGHGGRQLNTRPFMCGALSALLTLSFRKRRA